MHRLAAVREQEPAVLTPAGQSPVGDRRSQSRRQSMPKVPGQHSYGKPINIPLLAACVRDALAASLGTVVMGPPQAKQICKLAGILVHDATGC